MTTVMGTSSASNVIDVDVYARGQDGAGINSTSIEYQVGTSSTEVPEGTWSTEIVQPEQGQYLWTRTTYTYSNGIMLTSYNVSYFAIDGPKGDEGAYYIPKETKDETNGQIILTFEPSEEGLESIDFGNIRGKAGNINFNYVGNKSNLPTGNNIDEAAIYFVDTEFVAEENRLYDTYVYVNDHWEIINGFTKESLVTALSDFTAQLINVEAAAAKTTYYLTGVEGQTGSQKECSTGVTYTKPVGENGKVRVDGDLVTTNLYFNIN